MILLLKKCVNFFNIFMSSYLIYSGYNTAYITDYEALLLSLDQTVTQLITTLSLNMSSRSKINCGHCGQLNTVEFKLSNHWTVRHTLYNHQTTGHTLSNYWTVRHTLSNSLFQNDNWSSKYIDILAQHATLYYNLNAKKIELIKRN